MLREVKNGGLTRRLTPIGFRYQFEQGGRALSRPWGGSRQRSLLDVQRSEPVRLVCEERRTYWLFEGRFWWEDDGLDAADVLALLRQRERRHERKLASAHASLAADADERPRREPIPREVKHAVWERDGGACVECGSAFDIQYDHIIPFSRGGAATVANLQILCGDCNRAKGDAIA